MEWLRWFTSAPRTRPRTRLYLYAERHRLGLLLESQYLPRVPLHLVRHPPYDHDHLAIVYLNTWVVPTHES